MISVAPNGPAHRAGLLEGDILIALNGQNVSTAGDLHRLLATTLPGSDATLTILRDQERRGLNPWDFIQAKSETIKGERTTKLHSARTRCIPEIDDGSTCHTILHNARRAPSVRHGFLLQ